MDICIWMAESHSCSPETIRTLLISYTPTQIKKFKTVKKKKVKKTTGSWVTLENLTSLSMLSYLENGMNDNEST